MQENNNSTFSRKARLEDFLDDDEKTNIPNKHNRNQSHTDNNIEKNQQEFGHKRRIKP